MALRRGSRALRIGTSPLSAGRQGANSRREALVPECRDLARPLRRSRYAVSHTLGRHRQPVNRFQLCCSIRPCRKHQAGASATIWVRLCNGERLRWWQGRQGVPPSALLRADRSGKLANWSTGSRGAMTPLNLARLHDPAQVTCYWLPFALTIPAVIILVLPAVGGWYTRNPKTSAPD
jgi:hypothetical protein